MKIVVFGASRGVGLQVVEQAVVSALGPTRPPTPHAMEKSAENIVAGMTQHGVRRLVSTTGAGVRQPEDAPKLIDRLIGFLLHVLIKELVEDSAKNVRVIQASGLDWTIVRFPRLVDGAHTRKYRAGYVGKDSGIRISRADGAHFVLRELIENRWVCKAPGVSY